MEIPNARIHIVGLFLSLKTKTSHSVNTFLTSRPYECHFFSDFLDFQSNSPHLFTFTSCQNPYSPQVRKKKRIFYPFILTPSSPKNSFACRLLLTSTFTSSGKKNKRRKMVTSGMTHYVKKKKKKYPGARIFVFSTLNLTFSLSLRHQRISKYSSLFAIFFFFSCRFFFRVPYFHYHLHFYFRCAVGFGEIELERLPGKIFHRDNWISRLDFMIYGINIILVKIVIWA